MALASASDISRPQPTISIGDYPALLVLATRNVGYQNNFITINADSSVRTMSRTEAAANSNSYVGRIMTNPNATFVLQVHQIARGKLKALVMNSAV